MPFVRIETAGDWLRPRATELFDRVDAALVDVLGVPPADALIRLVCHDPLLIRLPATADPRFVFIEIALFPGRTAYTKRALYRALCDALAAIDVPPVHVCIALQEIGLDDWGLAGGQAARDLDFGFRVEV